MPYFFNVLCPQLFCSLSSSTYSWFIIHFCSQLYWCAHKYYLLGAWENLPGRLDPGFGFLLRCHSKWAEVQKWRANGLLSPLQTLKIIISHFSVFCHVVKGSSIHWKLITQRESKAAPAAEWDLAKHRRDEIITCYLNRQLPVNMQRWIKQDIKRYYCEPVSLAASESKKPSKQIFWYTENLFALTQGRQKSVCYFWWSEETGLNPFPGIQKGLFDNQSHCNWWANKSK